MLRPIIVLTLTVMLMLGSPMTLPLAAQKDQALAAQQKQNQNRPNRPANRFAVAVVGLVTGTVTGTFNGTATITRFARNGDQLVAVGTLTGSVTDATTGAVMQSVGANFSVPVTVPVASAEVGTAQVGIAQVGCEILNLALGPLHLDLLGLVIDIPNPILLNITAVPGAGNLLGNLLCAVVGLLDGGLPGALQQIVDLLNAILALL